MQIEIDYDDELNGIYIERELESERQLYRTHTRSFFFQQIYLEIKIFFLKKKENKYKNKCLFDFYIGFNY